MGSTDESVTRLQEGSGERWHGTPGGYTNHYCRCDECREAHAAAMRERRRHVYEGPCPFLGCSRRISKAAGTGYCEPCSRLARWAFAEHGDEGVRVLKGTPAVGREILSKWLHEFEVLT